MACVRARRGRWTLDFRDQTGTRRWITTKWPATDDHRHKAEKELARLAVAVDDGAFQSKTQQRDFAQLVDAYTRQLDVRTLTRADYVAIMGTHLTPFFGATKLRAITPQQIEDFRAWMQARGKSVRTINKILTQLSSMFRYAEGHGWVPNNPCKHVKKLRQALDHQRRAIDGNIFTWAEVERLIEHAGSTRDRTLFRMAVETGMRQGEFLALRWSDVDLASGRVAVHRSYRKCVESAPKTAASMRSIGLTPAMVSALRVWKLACPQPPGGPGLVFPNGAGGFENGKNLLQRNFYPALKRAGLKRVRFHDLRHTCASLLLAAGVNIYAAAAQLGHASATITLRVYGHLVPDSTSPGAAAFHALANPPGSNAVAAAPRSIEGEGLTSGSNVALMPVRTAS